MSDAADYVIRAMTNDGAFRVIVARTTATTREAVKRQEAEGAYARNLADLMTGAILVRETMAPQLRVEGILESVDGGWRLVADVHPDGGNRGLLQVSDEDATISFESGALLYMMRNLPDASLHRGVVQVPTSGGMSAAFMEYMQSSEQVVSMIAVGSVIDDESNVVEAGGFIVQLLPEVEHAPLAIMTERLAAFNAIEDMLKATQGSPEHILHEILDGFPHTMLDRSPLNFKCRCSDVRVMASLATLPREEIESMIAEEDTVELSCDYCGRSFIVSTARLHGLLDNS